jgi:uncharacterized protein YbjT (DUF2867 family)
VELALGLPAGRVPDISGPEVRTLANLTQAYLSAKGSKKGVVELPLPGKAARAFREGAQVAPASVWGDTASLGTGANCRLRNSSHVMSPHTEGKKAEDPEEKGSCYD